MKKLVSYGVGTICAGFVVLGAFLFVAPKPVAVAAAIVVICLSLAYGMLTADPCSLVALVAGICMWTLPGWIVGIVFVLFGSAGAVINMFIHKN